MTDITEMDAYRLLRYAREDLNLVANILEKLLERYATKHYGKIPQPCDDPAEDRRMKLAFRRLEVRAARYCAHLMVPSMRLKRHYMADGRCRLHLTPSSTPWFNELVQWPAN